MSRFREVLQQNREGEAARKGETVMNFMGGESYEINALDTLKTLKIHSPLQDEYL